MAGESDVGAALVATVSAILYPNGVSGDPPLTVLGCPARAYRGWPNGDALDADLRAQVLNVSVYPRDGTDKTTTRYRPRQQAGTLAATTYTLTAGVGPTITVGGAAASPYVVQNVCALCNGMPYVYQAQPGDTAAQVAMALGALISAGLGGTTVSGETIVLPDNARIEALRVGSTAPVITEVARQQKQFQVTIWAFSPAIRDQAVNLIKPALQALTFLTLGDGTRARVIFAAERSNDAPQKEILYRADLFFLIEWASTVTSTATEIVAVRGGINYAALDFVGDAPLVIEGLSPLSFGNYAATFAK